MNHKKPEFLIITPKDIQHIKNAAFGHIHDTLPRNLDHKEIQTLLICKGFVEYLGHQKIPLPVKIKYEWEES